MKPSAKQEISHPAPAAAKNAPKAACSSLTKAGAACKAPPTAGGACPMHSTRYSEEQKALWRLRGGHAARALHLPKTFVPSDASSAESILAMLDECANHVRSGSLPVSQANAVSNLAAVALKVGDLKLSARLAELEARLNATSGAPARKALSRASEKLARIEAQLAEMDKVYVIIYAGHGDQPPTCGGCVGGDELAQGRALESFYKGSPSCADAGTRATNRAREKCKTPYQALHQDVPHVTRSSPRSR